MRLPIGQGRPDDWYKNSNSNLVLIRLIPGPYAFPPNACLILRKRSRPRLLPRTRWRRGPLAMAPSRSSNRWDVVETDSNESPSRGRRVAELVDSPEFTVAFAWGLVFLGVAVPLL